MNKDLYNTDDELLVAMAQQGDSLSEEHLIRRYMNFVKKISGLYYITGADQQDVVQEGMIGLFKAVRSFETGRGASFKTFASKCINHQILEAIKNANRLKNSPLNESLSFENNDSSESGWQTVRQVVSTDVWNDPELAMLMREMSAAIIVEEDSLLSNMELEVWKEYLRGKSVREISKLLNISYKSTDNAMQRIKKKIIDFIIS